MGATLTGRRCPPQAPPVVIPCDDPEPTAHDTEGTDKLSLVAAKFADLRGWKTDKVGEALPAFSASCAKLAKLLDKDRVGSGPYGGYAKDWRAPCKAAAQLSPKDHAKARAFFEKYFRVYAAHGNDGPEGTFTGYYVQELRGSLKRTDKYQFPLFGRPRDLVEVQLSAFISDGRSRRIWGRVDPKTGKLQPYHTRDELRAAGIQGGQVVLWVDDPYDAFAVEVEGSGKAMLPDGKKVWIGFDGKNGRRGGRIASTMRALKQLKRLKARNQRMTPAQYLERYWKIMDHKKSLVFFEIQSRKGAIGTQEVILTPLRSLAVDRAVISLSTPIWVDTRAPTPANGGRTGPLQRLLIAQDTGGAIVGSVRGDIYFGDDQQAVRMGSRTYSKGRLWLMLPRAVKVAVVPPPKKNVATTGDTDGAKAGTQ